MKILDYITSWFLMNTIEDDDGEDRFIIENVFNSPTNTYSNLKSNSSSNGVNGISRLPAVSIIKVKSIDDAQYIVDRITLNSNVVINLQGVDKYLRADTLDFLNGAQYALGGELIHINDAIYIACTKETAIDTNFS